MAFGTRESSEDQGDIVALVEFKYGTNGSAAFRYTDHTAPITYLGNVYTPITFEHGSIKSTGKPDSANFTLKLPSSAGVCGLYYKRPPNTPVQMVVFAGHAGDIDFQQVWTGRVMSVKFSGITADLTLEPATISLQRTGLRKRYQLACPHVLYGSSCRATPAWANFSIASKTPYRIYVNEPILTPENYLGGVLRFNTADGSAFSGVLRANAGLKYFDVSRNTADLGSSIEVSFGCAKSLDYCNTVFANGANFGGCPFIPVKNPLGATIPQYP